MNANNIKTKKHHGYRTCGCFNKLVEFLGDWGKPRESGSVVIPDIRTLYSSSRWLRARKVYT